jgi:hypothetical protein
MLSMVALGIVPDTGTGFFYYQKTNFKATQF